MLVQDSVDGPLFQLPHLLAVLEGDLLEQISDWVGNITSSARGPAHHRPDDEAPLAVGRLLYEPSVEWNDEDLDEILLQETVPPLEVQQLDDGVIHPFGLLLAELVVLVGGLEPGDVQEGYVLERAVVHGAPLPDSLRRSGLGGMKVGCDAVLI